MEEWHELPKPYQQIAEVIGMEATLRLCRKFGGLTLYVPKLDKLAMAKRRELIAREWDGSNAADLAKKYGCSLRWVQKLTETLPIPQAEGQISIKEVLEE